MNKGFTLIEALIALLLLAITVVGSMAFYFYSNQSTAITVHRRMAVEFANSELEGLKNTPYDNIVSKSPAVNITTGNLSELNGKEEILVAEDVSHNFKQISVTITWTEPASGLGQNLVLNTYIAKR
ncbi:MAG: prepilin-type N-terminal cleavage/methylation domain-containing protein [Candidatus Omnitrophica bacterium]|nr:prepilin-type N-terminal cleavage/methylation domain-containing protein [Candidatus Omnitrophota bacterium]